MAQEKAKLQPQDRILRYTILPLIPKWVEPNHITLFRFFATPFVILLIVMENYVWGIPAFIFVAFTDAVDGSLARTRNQITDWGKLYDPLADKLLIGSMVFIIVMRYLNFYLALVLIVIEAIFIIGAWWRHRNGDKVQADIWGKIKMNLQVIGVLFLLFALLFQIDGFFSISAGTFYLAIVFAIISLFSHGI